MLLAIFMCNLTNTFEQRSITMVKFNKKIIYNTFLLAIFFLGISLVLFLGFFVDFFALEALDCFFGAVFVFFFAAVFAFFSVFVGFLGGAAFRFVVGFTFVAFTFFATFSAFIFPNGALGTDTPPKVSTSTSISLAMPPTFLARTSEA